MKISWCSIFGHSFRIASNSEQMWAQCKNCPKQVDIPLEREEEAFEKLRKRDWSWDERVTNTRLLDR